MKKIIFLLSGLLLSTAAFSQSLSIDIGYYKDYYYQYDDDLIYQYGFNINNYAYVYPTRFVNQIHREYGIPKSQVRLYLDRGFSPSDILYGAELSLYSRTPFVVIMDYYRNSPSRNWIQISIHFGVPRRSVYYNSIAASFRRYYSDWGNYYSRKHPRNPYPPVRSHSWSYFRPSPSAPSRPIQNSVQGQRRPSVSGNQPGSSSSSGNRRNTNVTPPNNSGKPGGSTAPATPGRNDNREPEAKPGNNSGNRGSSGNSTAPASPDRNGGNSTTSSSSNKNSNPAASSSSSSRRSSSSMSSSSSNKNNSSSTSDSNKNSGSASSASKSSQSSSSSSGSGTTRRR